MSLSWYRRWLKRRPRIGVRTQHRRRPLEIDRLEDRTLLSINLVGTPFWIDQGPNPIRFRPGCQRLADGHFHDGR